MSTSGLIIVVILILLLVGVAPWHSHSAAWGYGPSGLVGVLLVIFLILFLTGRL